MSSALAASLERTNALVEISWEPINLGLGLEGKILTLVKGTSGLLSLSSARRSASDKGVPLMGWLIGILEI